MKSKNTIRLTEGQLKALIKESVNQILKEANIDSYTYMRDNADSLKDYDNYEKLGREQMQSLGDNAQDKHPQTTPFAPIWNDSKPEHNGSYDSKDYKNGVPADVIGKLRAHNKDYQGF